mmetsp:Transcript_30894/g.22480  ORF Transcript_30894/g.22480 Transcript_30894/m.22480 type:complete len:114 (-) Transcript_30894:1556-1897(-)
MFKRSILVFLNLSGTSLRDKGIKYIAKGISTGRSSLEALDISRNEFTFKGAEFVAEIASHCTRLVELDVSTNKFGDKGMIMHLNNSFYHKRSTVKKLNFSHCQFSIRGILSLF